MRHESAGPDGPTQSTELVQQVQPRELVPPRGRAQQGELVQPRGPVRPECAKQTTGLVRIACSGRAGRAGRAGLATLALALALVAALLAAPPAAATESAAAAPARASGYASPWVKGERARLRLLAAPPCGTAAAPLLAGVEFDLAPGWKTYWRTPGAAGFGAEILWEGSQNFTRIEYFWPRPERFRLFGEETLGYEGRFILPVQVVPRSCDEPLVLEARVLYLVCETLCIPHEAALALTVPPMTAPGGLVAAPSVAETDATDEEAAGEDLRALLAAAFAQVPTEGGHQLRLSANELRQAGRQEQAEAEAAGGPVPAGFLALAAETPLPFADPDVFAESELALFGAPQAVRTHETGFSLELPLFLPPGRLVASLQGQPVALTLFDAQASADPAASRGWELRARLGEAGGEGGEGAGARGGGAGEGASGGGAGRVKLPLPLPLILLLALAGGLVLNIMPCVLPVLSLKLLAVLRGGGEKGEGQEAWARRRRELRTGFALSSLGIYLVFAGLAAAALAARHAGLAFGWGVQFQQPLFLGGMALLCTLFAAWLAGWWRVNLPLHLLPQPAAGGEARAGASGRTEESRSSAALGHIASGAFAALLATPCSAPFLGLAVGFALVLPDTLSALIFAALATGFAAPWLAVAAWPGLARRLPRPGAWMAVLERIFALGLALTALWLVWVFQATAGQPAAALLLAALAGLLAWLAWRARGGIGAAGAAEAASAGAEAGTKAGTARLPSRGVTAALACLALAATVYGETRGTGGEASGGGSGGPAAKISGGIAVEGPPRRAGFRRLKGGATWGPFTGAEAVPARVAAGETVVLVFTADWCITCKVNEAGALSSPAVAAALAGPGVVPLLGDWTRPDPAIAAWLERHGRFGIPFTAVYGPGAPRGLLLPELLTESALLDALAAAKG